MATRKETRTDISVGGKRIVREPMRQGGHKGEFTEFEHAVPEAGTSSMPSILPWSNRNFQQGKTIGILGEI